MEKVDSFTFDLQPSRQRFRLIWTSKDVGILPPFVRDGAEVVKEWEVEGWFLYEADLASERGETEAGRKRESERIAARQAFLSQARLSQGFV